MQICKKKRRKVVLFLDLKPSKKIVRRWFFCWHSPRLLRRGFKNCEVTLQVFVQLQDGGDVATPIAVIGRRPDSQNRLVEVPLVAFHYQLVSAANHVNIVRGVELCHHVTPEEISGATWRNAPTLRVLGVGPKKVAHRSVVGNFLFPVYGSNLI